MKKKRIILFSLLIFVILGLIQIKKDNKNSTNPLGLDKSYRIRRVFKSERAFGDDHFDIYVLGIKEGEESQT